MMFLYNVKSGALLAALSLEYFRAQAQDLVMVHPVLLQFLQLVATDLCFLLGGDLGFFPKNMLRVNKHFGWEP